MKKSLISLSILAVAFASCQKPEPVAGNDPTKVSFVIETEVTRTVTNGKVTTFVEGDQIGITSSGLANEMANAEFEVADNGSLTGAQPYYYNEDNPAVFYAHYPYTAAYADGKVTMTVSSDQSTEAKYNANDFLTSTATGNPADGGKVSFRFHHRLTLVKVIWNGSLTASEVAIKNVKPQVEWAYADNKLTTGGSAIEVNMWKTSANAQEYWAVIPAQTLAKGTELLVINDAAKKYSYTTSADIDFNEGMIKKITLNLLPDNSVEATFSDVEIEDWGEDEGVVGEVEEVVTPPVELISAAEGKNITLVPNSKGNAAAGAWNVAVESGNVIETTQDGELHFNIAAGSWWNNAVYYRPADEKAAQIKPTLYKLTFEAKADAALKGFMVQVMKGDETGNTYFGIINSDPTGKADVTYNRMYYPSFKDNQAGLYVKMTYWVNFAQIIDAGGTTITEAKAGDFSKVLLTLSINTGNSDANAYGVDFHFRNFEFVEVK